MSRGRRRLPRKPRGREPRPQHLDIDPVELRAIVECAKPALSAEQHAKLTAVIDTLVFVTAELRASGASIERLRTLLLGAQSEKTRHVLGALGEVAASQARPRNEEAGARPKPPGHGRNGALAYSGAAKVVVPHPDLHRGDPCPACAQARLYLLPPEQLVRVAGMAPLSATVYEKERLRCASCGEVLTAPSPAGVGEKKYDESVAAMIGLLKYGTGMPFHRLEKLQASLGIPLPASTQWQLVRDSAELLTPGYEELLRQAAQGQVLYNDDTAAKILDLTPQQRAEALGDDKADERTGVFTSGIVATGDDHRIAVFCTGVRHAGENLAEVLQRRQRDLPRPIQMCDGSANNTCGDFAAILANCIAHARRKYVEVVASFPEPCTHVLELLGKVYAIDAEASKQGLSADERLARHQQKSAPLMAELNEWGRQQIAERKVEPNSGLGQAIAYMHRRWDALTLFLRKPGAPLDSNLVERALKKAILHRKNALFFKTTKGARVSDLYMSLIHTCELNRVNPFDYLLSLLRHHHAVAGAPAHWMPWNYKAAQTRPDRGS